MQDAANRLRIERLAGVAEHVGESSVHRHVSPVHDHLRVSAFGAAVAAAGASIPNVASIAEAARWHSSALGDTHHLRRLGELMAHMHAGAFGTMPSKWSEPLGRLARLMGDRRGMLEVAHASGAFGEAERLARFASPYVLPTGLAAHEVAATVRVERLAAGNTVNPPSSPVPGMMCAFAGALAMFRTSEENVGVNREVPRTKREFEGMAMPPGMSVSQSSVLVDATGLGLPFSRVPRLLDHAFLRFCPPPTQADRKARLHFLKRSGATEVHDVRAYRRAHDTKWHLRRFIDKPMTELYCYDWLQERLPDCGCNDLLGKAVDRGGSVLENAD